MPNRHSTFAKGRPNHSKDELNAVAALAKTGDAQARHDLGEMMQPYVIGYLKNYRGDYAAKMRDEITQAAWVGVFEALERWDPKADVKFSTYSHLWMKGEVQRWLAENSGVLPLPRQAWADAHAVEKQVHYNTGGTVMPYELHDDELAKVKVTTPTKTKTFPSAGAAFRARQQAYALDPDYEPRKTKSAEENFMEETLDLDAETLAAIGFIKEALQEGTDEAEDMAWTIAFDLVDSAAAQDIVLDAHHIMEVAGL